MTTSLQHDLSTFSASRFGSFDCNQEQRAPTKALAAEVNAIRADQHDRHWAAASDPTQLVRHLEPPGGRIRASGSTVSFFRTEFPPTPGPAKLRELRGDVVDRSCCEYDTTSDTKAASGRPGNKRVGSTPRSARHSGLLHSKDILHIAMPLLRPATVSWRRSEQSGQRHARRSVGPGGRGAREYFDSGAPLGRPGVRGPHLAPPGRGRR